MRKALEYAAVILVFCLVLPAWEALRSKRVDPSVYYQELAGTAPKFDPEKFVSDGRIEEFGKAMMADVKLSRCVTGRTRNIAYDDTIRSRAAVARCLCSP